MSIVAKESQQSIIDAHKMVIEAMKETKNEVTKRADAEKERADALEREKEAEAKLQAERETVARLRTENAALRDVEDKQKNKAKKRVYDEYIRKEMPFHLPYKKITKRQMEDILGRATGSF